MLLIFPWLRSPIHLGIATLVWAFAADSFRPASMTAVSQLVAPSRRKAAYSSLRLAINLGMSIGPALGGFLATRSFRWVFGVDGVTAILAGIVLWLAPWRAGGVHGAARSASAANVTPPWRNWHYLFFLAATLPVGLVFFQSISTMAVYVTRDLGLSTAAYGLLFTVNTVLIVFLEVSLSTATAHWPHGRTLALGSLLVGFGFGALALARDTFTAMLTVVVWTFGEMVFFPGTNAFVAEMAPAGRTGTFMGLYTMTFGLSLVLAPWLGTQAMQHFGARAPWIAALGCGVLSAVLLGRMSPRPAGAAPASQVILSTAEGDA
jgi:predicted MFS family arabinose efflux permease